MNFNFNFNDLNNKNNKIVSNKVENEVSDKDIAIIGMNAKIGSATNLEEIWNALCNGEDLVTEFPYKRFTDANNFNLTLHGEEVNVNFPQKAYLNEVDQFDASLFNISPTEAKLMNPIQRIYLESAWSAFEDAGYSNKSLDGTQTAVYLGYNSTGNNYDDLLANHINDDNYGVSVSGNVNSIIASRISYLLNLRGASVVVDTACSSSLVALHLACQSLRKNETSLALVGGIRVFLLPDISTKGKMGIMSTSERTKTFDDSADGTGSGEGVISIVLKPLYQAVEDRDHIYATIKGSSMNQDGTSMGITAPNPKAQEQAMIKAWKDADINPETISYIEAHGTATNLGDPIEIEGIESAFARYTDKKQFCAIGSIKSNSGHLDCAAGLAGLVKAVLMLNYKKIPAMVHFKVPNQKINFINSPVYVNDKLTNWDSEGVRRCGISSFGISGTNCHVILEEAPKVEEITGSNDFKILTVSAKSKEAFHSIVEKYMEFLKKDQTINIDDFCYTANIGRGNFPFRSAVVVLDCTQILEKGLLETKALCSEIRIVDEIYEYMRDCITISEKRELDKKAQNLLRKMREVKKEEHKELLYELCDLYRKGADIEWDELYKGKKHRKISIPGYQFNHKRYWVDYVKENKKKVKSSNQKISIFIDECILSTYNMNVYKKDFSAACLELREHKINEEYVLPGTVYVEIAHQISSRHFRTSEIEITNLIFLQPFLCHENEIRTMHIIVTIENDMLSIVMCSKNEEEFDWTSHVELKVKPFMHTKVEQFNIQEVINRMPESVSIRDSDKAKRKVKLGEHWDVTKEIYYSKDEIVACLELDEKFENEMQDYYLYPSLLDGAVNCGNILSNEFNLPLSYHNARFYQAFPRKIYSYLKRLSLEKESNEVTSFHALFITEEGTVIGEVENYVLKRVSEMELLKSKEQLPKDMFSDLVWEEVKETQRLPSMEDNNTILIIRESDDYSEALSNDIMTKIKGNVIEIKIDKDYNKINDNLYETSIEKLLDVINDIGNDISFIIDLLALKEDGISDYSSLKHGINTKLKDHMRLIKEFVHASIHHDINYVLLTLNADRVVNEDVIVNPINQALIGMSMCYEYEYSNIKTSILDIDKETSNERMIQSIFTSDQTRYQALRRNRLYQRKIILKNTVTRERESKFKNDSVILLAGGLGGIGLSICKSISKEIKNAKFIILNRRYDSTILEENEVSSLKTTKNVLKNVISDGNTVEVMKVDISDYDEMKQCISHIRNKYGKISGVINAAGVEGKGFVMNKQWSEFEAVIKPKIYGTWVLHELTLNDELDFFIMFSSYTSVFGSAGQTDYSAGNAFLDSFANYRRNKNLCALTINWTGWNESGMAVRNGVDTKTSLLNFVTDKEGSMAFEYAQRIYDNRVLVGQFNYEILSQGITDISRYLSFDKKILDQIDKFKTKSNERKESNIVITGKRLDLITDIEKQVAYVWAKTLGINEVCLYDKFFEIGGNSLLASYLHKELSKVFPGVLAITDIFIYSSVYEIAKFISDKTNKKPKIIEEIVENDIEDGDDQDLEMLVNDLFNGKINIKKLEDLL